MTASTAFNGRERRQSVSKAWVARSGLVVEQHSLVGGVGFKLLFKGMLVELPGRRGVAKLQSMDETRCIVSVFRSVSRHEDLDLSRDDIARAFLSPQTRVYVKRDDRIRIGRVRDYLQQANGLVDYEIRFPNGSTADISELDLYVRPWDAPEDPAEVLACGGAESQYLHDRRRAAIEPLRDLRSACQGLTALASAGVDLVPHQVAAVRRVLTDPVQRYLLADEVGLGKTIEAGLIIRQHLIDAPETTVLVVTPAHLREQWTTELQTKLRLDQFGESFEVISHEDLGRVSRSPDILVVDEAHHLVGGADPLLAAAAERLADLSPKALVLLLLSATPPLGDEARFLALLNLLDPQAHPLGDLEGFRTKLEQRRGIGRLLLSLDPESPSLVLRQRGLEMERLFPSDPEIARLAPRLIAATREAPDEVAEICLALRTHIADTYRIHQRLIRSRRADAQGWEFRPRGPAVEEVPDLRHVRAEADPDPHIAPLMATLEEWRFSATEAVGRDGPGERAAALRYGRLLEALASAPDALSNRLATMTPLFPDEPEILARLTSIAAERDRAGAIATMVESTLRLLKTVSQTSSRAKIVVFAGSTVAADQYLTALNAAAPDLLSAGLLSGRGSADLIDTFARSNKSFVLVLDQSGEEGLNLSCADAIVHLDLPISIARFEQRIGRLDRFGRMQDLIRQRLLIPSDDDDSPWQGWLDLIGQGLLIFNGSTSDVQFLLEDIEAEALTALFRNGPAGLADLIPDIRDRIAEERRSQDEQYALDRLALAETPVDPFIQQMDDAEADEAEIDRCVEGWLVGTLQLKRRPAAWPEIDPFTLTATPTTLIPRVPWLTQFVTDLPCPVTWRRRVATRHPDASLLRPGTPLVDAMERYTRWDDRGTAFMTWRTLPSWTDEPWLGFRLCFAIEPDLPMGDLLAPGASDLARWRKAQQYFQIESRTLYIDVNGEPVEAPEILSLLEGPYRKAGEGAPYQDLNLGSRPQHLSDVIDPTMFDFVARSARDRGAALLSASDDLRRKIDDALLAAQADLRRRRQRTQAGDASAGSAAALIEGVLPGLAQPAIRLDAIGFFIISNTQPQRSAHGRP